MNGVGFLTTMKNFAPSIRRRRRGEKPILELQNGNQAEILPWDSIPTTPITPPAAFLPPGYERLPKKIGKTWRLVGIQIAVNNEIKFDFATLFRKL
jgi:hypothetical protein